MSPKLAEQSTMSKTFTINTQSRSMHASLDAKRSPFSSHQTLKKPSLAQSMIENQQSWAFKSKSDKVAIYKDEEKRIRLLYGGKQNLKYKIKLND